ncbi:hypothetical protein B0H16DRAFT_1451365 [Mycena metata]|uniref:Uncharacterized protein n=1 Tax=Mycena metata TaxID=1033252 RepID=A0AAD7JUX9_9AGAR|nr:hypothetical protein B0H16DRAFT_1451365 [Mycena metata]
MFPCGGPNYVFGIRDSSVRRFLCNELSPLGRTVGIRFFLRSNSVLAFPILLAVPTRNKGRHARKEALSIQHPKIDNKGKERENRNRRTYRTPSRRVVAANGPCLCGKLELLRTGREWRRVVSILLNAKNWYHIVAEWSSRKIREANTKSRCWVKEGGAETATERWAESGCSRGRPGAPRRRRKKVETKLYAAGSTPGKDSDAAGLVLVLLRGENAMQAGDAG